MRLTSFLIFIYLLNNNNLFVISFNINLGNNTFFILFKYVNF